MRVWSTPRRRRPHGCFGQRQPNWAAWVSTRQRHVPSVGGMRCAQGTYIICEEVWLEGRLEGRLPVVASASRLRLMR